MRCNFVMFQIIDGPDQDFLHSHSDETMSFWAMKAAACPSDDENVLLVLRPVLAEPVELRVKVKDITSRADGAEKIIRGKIVNEVSRGRLLPDFRDDTGLTFLKKDADVKIKYSARTKTGAMTFQRKHGEGWLRMWEHNQWLYSLENVNPLDQDDYLCYEVDKHAQLNGFLPDPSTIRRANDIGRHADCTLPNYSLSSTNFFARSFYASSLLHGGTQIIWV